MKKRYKHPKTVHLPYSLTCTSDDKKLKDTIIFKDKQVVVTEKMDGENSSLYSDGLHARSIDSKHHESRSWLKSFHSEICSLIPENIRICGENMFAKHSIEYNNLDSYFYGFSAWKDDVCLSWEETIKIFNETGVETVPILYEGIYDEELIKNLFNKDKPMEGFVVRIKESFKMKEFSKSVSKFVRENHVQSEKHWMSQKVVPNKLTYE